MRDYLRLAFWITKFNRLMNSITKNRVISLVVLFLMVFANSAVIANSSSEVDSEEFKRQRVLFISAYDSSFPTFFNQLSGLQATLKEDEYQIDIEYMDTKRFYTEENLKNFDERIVYKIDNLEPYDVIVVGDDNALQYAMDNQTRLFDGIPIVFLGINDLERAEKAFAMGGITGVVETTSIKETLDLAISLQTEAKEMLIVVDNTSSGQGELKQILYFNEFYPGIDFQVFDLSKETYNELSGKLTTLDEETILLMLAAYSDVDQHKMTFYEYLNFVKYYSNVPIYHLYDFGIGNGVLGGVVVDYFQQGKKAGETVVRVTHGVNPEDIKPLTDKSTNSAIIDFKVFKAYNLDTAKLPIDTYFVNRPVSFLDKNKEVILTTSAIGSILLVIIIILVLNIQRRKQIEKSLNEKNEELSALYEEMIAMNEELESAEEEIRESYEHLSIKNKDLEESEQRYKNVFDLSHSAMWEHNLLTNDMYLTKEWYLHIFEEKGYQNLENLEADSIMDLFYSHLDKQTLTNIKGLQAQLKEGSIDSYNQIISCCKKADKPMFIEEKGRSILNRDGDIIGIVGSHSNITAAVLYEQQLEEFAYKDQLTSMPNRLILENKLKERLSSNIDEIVSGSVILLDVDNFKFINNTYGHEIGDEILVEIAKRLNDTLGSIYTLGRISGDEFVLICDGLHDKQGLEDLAKEIILLFDKRFNLRDRSIYITMSAGIAVYPENGNDLDTLLNRCNSAIHEAKVKGKNRYDFYDISMNETMENKIYIQNNIREAIEKELFELFYQPLYNVDDDKINGFEALIRWNDPQRGYIPPLEFIVVAEKMGLINKLGDWVIREAAKFIKYMTANIDEHLYVSVNVSSVQLLQSDFVELVSNVIDEVDIDYHSLCIEITETALMHSFEKNIDKLLQLRNKGIRISLDDFGTGYSSLNYLRRLPVDILKIDKSFIDEIILSSEGRELTEGIILLAQKMGIYVVAEGIEESEQLKYLQDYKCDGIQGYLISKPIKMNEIKTFYDEFTGIAN